ncbi:MAG: HlyD family efflux transporter periplasmic adaptor subunit, partial [Novosphingobium sp.]
IRNLAAADSQNRRVVKAAYAGVVEKLAFTAVGGVVRPAEPIMEIVPIDDTLIVEAAISPADIEQVQVGQPARIRFSTINSTATPEIAGKVFYVAADPTVRERDGSSYFPVRVRIDAEMLKRYPELKLRTGMPAEAFSETGSRSMLSYLTKPLRDQFARAFRDN